MAAPVEPTPPRPLVVLPRRTPWQVGVDLGARARSSGGWTPDTALRLGWGTLLATVDWQPESDLVTDGRPVRVQAVGFALGMDWPAYTNTRWRLSLPLAVMGERSVLQRRDVAGAQHVLWQGGARAGVRVAWALPGGWFLAGSVDGRVMPLGGVAVADGPALDFNRLSARAGVGLLFVSE